MKKMNKLFVGLTVSTTAIVAGTLSGFAIAAAVPAPVTPQTEAVLSEADLSVLPVDKFPTNDAGKTYGLVDQGLVTDHTIRAELLFVTTDEGRDGYAYHDDLLPGFTQESVPGSGADDRGEPYEVAVYELDGVTMIGYHTVNRDASR